MSTEAARLVDELTTLLYEVRTGWQDSAGGRQIVRCGACNRNADNPESVVHERDCPVYRLQQAEAANTAVIRANAEEIADLEDARDDLEAKVNALTAERDAATARAEAAEAENKNLDAVVFTYWLALMAIRAADDYDHATHEDCPGAVANEALKTAQKLTAAALDGSQG